MHLRLVTARADAPACMPSKGGEDEQCSVACDQMKFMNVEISSIHLRLSTLLSPFHARSVHVTPTCVQQDTRGGNAPTPGAVSMSSSAHSRSVLDQMGKVDTALLDREEAGRHVKAREAALELAVVEDAERRRALEKAQTLHGTWRGRIPVGLRNAQMDVKGFRLSGQQLPSEAARDLEDAKREYACLCGEYERETALLEAVRRREAEKRRDLWFQAADAAIFQAHIKAARTKRWNADSLYCKDSVSDLHHTTRLEVPSTYGRRYPLIMTELTSKAFTKEAFEEMGVSRDTFTRGSVVRQALPYMDVDSIEGYLRRQPKPTATEVTSMPWLDPGWVGWSRSDEK